MQGMIDDETFTCPPEGGRFKKWLLGYAVPGLVVLYAMFYGVFDGKLSLPLKHGSIEFEGNSARVLAVSYISLASFMHFHFGWGLSDRLWMRSQRGKWISLGLLISTATLAVYLNTAGRI